MKKMDLKTFKACLKQAFEANNKKPIKNSKKFEDWFEKFMFDNGYKKIGK